VRGWWYGPALPPLRVCCWARARAAHNSHNSDPYCASAQAVARSSNASTARNVA
jgi:hypothetical protein